LNAQRDCRALDQHETIAERAECIGVIQSA
jgi:hypothetical protein